MYKYFVFFVSVLLFYSCNSEKKQSREITKTIQIDTTKKVSKKWFEIVKQDSSNILFVVLDPHGDALLAKNKFESICNQLNINMISPYTVKNNSAGYINQINLCIEQYPQKNQQVYLVGFSGGARMAFQYAIKNYKKVKGLIMCGAGIGRLMQKKMPFPLVMIAGKNDFNMIEQYYSPFNTQLLKNTEIISLLFDGKHEWPDSFSLKMASEFVLSKSSTYKLRNKEILEKYKNTNSMNKTLDSYKYLEILYKNNPKDKEVFTELKNTLQDKSFQKNITEFENLLQTEQKRNQLLAQNLYDKDFSYWKNKINEIDKIIKHKGKESESYSRSKAFLGVAIYSLCQREMQNPQSNQIQKLLKIYEVLEPNNKEMLKMKMINKKNTLD